MRMSICLCISFLIRCFHYRHVRKELNLHRAWISRVAFVFVCVLYVRLILFFFIFFFVVVMPNMQFGLIKYLSLDIVCY